MMEVQQIKIDREQAREYWRDYKKHVHWSAPIDDEIRRTYHLIAQGKTVIKALDSIRLAGVGDDGLPKLAIARADAEVCRLAYRSNGSVTMTDDGGWMRRNNASISRWFDWPPGSFPAPEKEIWSTRSGKQAIIPHIPIHLRPARGLANYHVLWEAVWEPAPPLDPILLRRIGKGDLWLVLAAWDLTEVERAAMAARINTQ